MDGMRVCRVCGEGLGLAYFGRVAGGGLSDRCEVCVGEERVRKRWTVVEVVRLVRAARRVCDFWPRYMDVLGEADRGALRELVCAVDRIPDMKG